MRYFNFQGTRPCRFSNLTRQISGSGAGPAFFNRQSSKKGDDHVGSFQQDCPNLIYGREKKGAARGSGNLNMKSSKEGVDRNGSFPDPRNLDGFFICKSITYKRFYHREILVQAHGFRSSLKTLYLVHCAKTDLSFSRTARRPMD